MSELSSISHEYASTADFSRAINDDVLVLKKRFIHGAKGAPTDKVSQSATRLGHMLTSLLIRMGEASPISQPVDFLIPEDVLMRIETDHRGDRGYLIADLQRLTRALLENASLQQSDLQLLDTICEAADASASATFRKLWRR